jgi:hypothetical protein
MSFDFSTLILDSDRRDDSAAPSHGSVVLAEARRGHPSIEKARGSGLITMIHRTRPPGVWSTRSMGISRAVSLMAAMIV